jgi:hypothetical protein
VNLDTLAQNDTLQHDIGRVYSAGGFTLTASHFSPISNPPSFEFLGTHSPFSPGRTALYHHISLGEITLTRSDGGYFYFYSIDLAELPGGDQFGRPINSGPFGLTFYGTKANGATVSDTVIVDSFLTLKTYTLVGFDDMAEVHWFQGGPPISPTHQFDNLVVSAIPEPSSFCLLGIGTAVFAAWRSFSRRGSRT